MPALINTIIPKQAFEIVRDLIGGILVLELQNQISLQSELSGELNLYVGRMTPFQQSEKLMINVLVDSASYNSIQQVGVHGTTTFFIDVYASSKQTSELNGGQASTIIRDKWIGMIRTILEDTHYKTLVLAPGTIMGVAVKGFENYTSKDAQDSAFVKVSRLTLDIKMTEQQTLWSGVLIENNLTGIKLGLTERGYKYEFEESLP